MTDTLIVNLYGAPGAGKSTGAAYIFYKLKSNGIDAELVTEYAKDKVWEEHDMVFKDQCYIFGHQHFRLTRLIGKVRVIVTDSPLLLSAFYGDKRITDQLAKIAFITFGQNASMSYFIERKKKYNPNGRFQTEEESNKISGEIKSFIESLGIGYTSIEGTEHGYDKIVNDIINYINLNDEGLYS